LKKVRGAYPTKTMSPHSFFHEYDVMRKSSLFFSFLSIEIVVLALLLVHAAISQSAQHKVISEKASLVKALRLTDLCLFTDARYTRHLSQADLNTPFQDHPLSLEHFPSGSFVQPPKEIIESP
jgi:hypothetical protein